MTAFCTITENGQLRSFQDLKDRSALRNQDLFRYFQLREYYNKEIRRENPNDVSTVIEIMINA